MPGTTTLAVVSDIHYASRAEQERGSDYEFRPIANPLTRAALKAYRHYIWLRDPLARNELLTQFLRQCPAVQHVVANGDYSCDSAFLGLSDDAACQSARECLDQLRCRFGSALHANLGDHEFGKFSLAGGLGGMRLASYDRARNELGLAPFWTLRLGRYVLIGVTSSLVALETFEAETIPDERPGWERLRQLHMEEIRGAFSGLGPRDRVVLFCHDPTALPFLAREEAVVRRFPQIEHTVIGHLHSGLILWKSRLLAGMPKIHFLGHSIARITGALHQAKLWKPFRVRLCPALAGIELLNDGGFLLADLDPDARRPAVFRFQRLLHSGIPVNTPPGDATARPAGG